MEGSGGLLVVLCSGNGEEEKRKAGGRTHSWQMLVGCSVCDYDERPLDQVNTDGRVGFYVWWVRMAFKGGFEVRSCVFTIDESFLYGEADARY